MIRNLLKAIGGAFFFVSVSAACAGVDLTASVVTGQLLSAGLPIAGVSIGHPIDKTLWRVTWVTPPTDQQRALAQTVITNLDTAVEVAKAEEAAAVSHADVMAKGIIDVLVAKGVCTRAEARAAIKAVWQANQ